MQAVLHSGRSLDAAGSALDLAAMFGDGGNLYAYLGANPRGRSDPLGLFFTSPADLVGHAVMIGMRGVRGGLENMTAEYAANMEDDLDWAMDWSRPDNDYSRLSNTWVAQSFAEGMRGGFGAGLNAAMSDLSFGLVGGEEGDGGPVMAAGWLPAVKLTGRIHGGTSHMKKMISITKSFIRKKIPKSDIRNNQQMVDLQGNSISKYRPDIQVIDKAHRKVYLLEIVFHNPGAFARQPNMIDAATKAFPGFKVIWREYRL